MRCSVCGTENPPTAKFCQECGNRLAVAAQAPQSDSGASGERRQLTVMFCDLVGSTELSSQFDPEEWREIVNQYLQTASETARAFGGHVAQYLGDGVVVFFGYPEAHEDDAERAVRASLNLLSALEAHNQRLRAGQRVQLSARVGIHTGLVLADALGLSVGLVYGQTPNLASRVQTAAEPNTIFITATTYHLVGASFVVEDRGFHQLKGVPNAMHLYRVVAPTTQTPNARLQRARGQPSLFVGRENERQLLAEIWARAQAGHGQLVLITGEAGIGKSRLLQQLKDDFATAPHSWAECGASPNQLGAPFAPIIDLLLQSFGSPLDTPADERFSILERALQLGGFNLEVAVPLVSALLGLTIPDRYPPLLISPEQQRRRLIAILVDWVFIAARQQPQVLVVEDLQWADPSTLEVLSQHADRCADVPVLYLFTARPDFVQPWVTPPHHTHVRLNRLAPDEVGKMVVYLAGSMGSTASTTAEVVARTDGVPLYVVELMRELADVGVRALNQIPSSLQDLLTARLDRLGPAKEVAQVGAVIGREFAYPVLHGTLSGMPESRLRELLDQLLGAELLNVQGQIPDAVYSFRHALARDAAYGLLPNARRRELHHSVARVLSKEFSDLIAIRPELLAHHYTEAGESDAAVRAWQEAGDKATARAAFKEAAQHYTRALEIFNAMPHSPDDVQRELSLLVSQGQALVTTEGWGSPAADKPYQRARDILEHLGDVSQAMVVMTGMRTAPSSRGEHRVAQEIDAQMLQIAERDGSPKALVYAHNVAGITRYMQGDPAGSWQHMNRAIALYREEDFRDYPLNPFVTTHMHGSWALWRMGLADQARQKSRDQFEYAKRLQPFDTIMGHCSACLLFYHLRQPEVVSQHAEALMQFAEMTQLPVFLGWGLAYRGWVLATTGQPQAGIELIRQGLAKLLATGTLTAHRVWLAMLAEAYLLAGDPKDGLSAIADGLDATQEEEIFLPDLWCLRGDLLRCRAVTSESSAESSALDLIEAESSYRTAISIAQSQGSQIMALRAATRLGNMLVQQGRLTEARVALEPIYAAITEGMDTVDIREATALMAVSSAEQADAPSISQ